MDKEIAKCAVASVMEVYSRDDFDYITSLCFASIEAYNTALAEAGYVMVPREPSTQ